MAGYTQEEYEESQDMTPVDPPKGSADWAAQNSGSNAPELKPTENPAKGTLEAHEQSQGQNPPTSTVTTATTDGNTEQKDPDVSVDPNAGKPQADTDGPTQAQRDEATAGYDSQIAALNKAMEQYAPETPEQRKKREKREKAQKIVAAISDGLQAVSNLFFTSQYAPNMYNHEKSSMVKSETARLDKLKAEREANADKYFAYALKAGDAANGRAKTLRELEAQHEAQRLARAKAAREEEAQGWQRALQPDKLREQAGKASKAEQDAITAKATADVAPELAAANVAAKQAHADSYKASASASRAAAAASSRSHKAEFTAWDEKGGEHHFQTKTAADAFARQHGTYQEEDVTSVSETDSDTNGKSTTTKTTKSGHAAKPSPTGGNGKKKSPTA